MRTKYLTALKRNYKFDFTWMIKKDNKQLFSEFKSNVNLKTALVYLNNVLKENIKYWEHHIDCIKENTLNNLIKSSLIIDSLISDLKVPDNLFNPNEFKVYLSEHFEKFFNDSTGITTVEDDGSLPQVILVESRLIFIAFNVITDKFKSSLVRLNFQERYKQSLDLTQDYYEAIKEIFE